MMPPLSSVQLHAHTSSAGHPYFTGHPHSVKDVSPSRRPDVGSSLSGHSKDSATTSARRFMVNRLEQDSQNRTVTQGKTNIQFGAVE